MSDRNRPRVAAIVTQYFQDSHADVIVSKLIEGYRFRGEATAPRIEIASLYLDQDAPDDIGRDLAAKHSIPVFATTGEAMTLGGQGIAVDGVLLVGEHGDYPVNDRGQIMYPRRRFFDAAVAAMIAGGRTVPVFVDKHFSWSFAEAQAMAAAAERLGIPLLAGSTVPISWRDPAVEWPLGQPMTEAVALGYGPLEVYEFHSLEGLQCMTERRAGGETGVLSVHDLPPSEIPRAIAEGRIPADLFDAALLACGLTSFEFRQARSALRRAFLLEYRDGLRAAVLHLDDPVRDFGFAARGEDGILACRFALEPRRPYGHFTFLVRQIEELVLAGHSPYPAARTLLTTGVLDAAMRSRHLGGARVLSPELAVRYDPAAWIADTGVAERPPFGPA